MLVARLICSDEACAERFEAAALTLVELEALACDCGCALQMLGWPDSVDDADAADHPGVGCGPDAAAGPDAGARPGAADRRDRADDDPAAAAAGVELVLLAVG